jgi:hypothetical protein
MKLLVVVCFLSAAPLGAAEVDELTIKREPVYEFTTKPTVVREGRSVIIAFASKGYCDVTVAIEEAAAPADGHAKKILRHLASGVLGPNAPQPLQKESTAQRLVWDGKDDRGDYVDLDAVSVRVSLGLKPQFERTLYWSPKKRASSVPGRAIAMQAAPEGMYVFDGGQAIDHVRLFGHGGEYVRTIYPFPAAKVNDVTGLFWHQFPHDGRKLPIKPSYQQCTLLTSGSNALNVIFKDDRYFYGAMDPGHHGENTWATTDIAVANGRIALAAHILNRFATDGSSGGMNIYGPRVDIRNPEGMYVAPESTFSLNMGGYGPLKNLRPCRFALSPDGKWLYLCRYMENYAHGGWNNHSYWQHMVCRMSMDGSEEPKIFAGAVGPGSDDKHFNMPADIACDSTGRVYIADCGNGRVQVFSPDGALLKSVTVESPAQVSVSPKSGAMYVFSWPLANGLKMPAVACAKPFTLRKFTSADEPSLIATFDLPMSAIGERFGSSTVDHCAEVDFWSAAPTIWVSPGRLPLKIDNNPRQTGILVLAEKGAELELIDDFAQDATKQVTRIHATERNKQRLYWDPKRELLYVGEGGNGYHFDEVTVIDPSTGTIRIEQLPFDAEDMCFDNDGLVYLRTPTVVARYDPLTWREVPWDYGEEHTNVAYATTWSSPRRGKLASGLTLPTNSTWHHGGMYVSATGNIVVGCLYRLDTLGPQPAGAPSDGGKPYRPKQYPGRLISSAYGCEYIHIWNKHGQVIHEDAVPGLGTVNGVAIDSNDHVYVLSAATRCYGGAPYYNFLTGTLMKFPPAGGKIVCESAEHTQIKLSDSGVPNRPPDLVLGGRAWVEGAEWLFGGIGWQGKNHGEGCGCRSTRFGFDYFARSFAPEIDRYSVAVIDSSGNVITRVGTYGNVDDGNPLIAEGGPPNTHALGGDEVAFMHGAYVSTQSDRRLFVADAGNARIVSVKLGYHAEESVELAGYELK